MVEYPDYHSSKHKDSCIGELAGCTLLDRQRHGTTRICPFSCMTPVCALGPCIPRQDETEVIEIRATSP